MTPTAEIISIGDELLYGQTLNTNSHWMGSALDKIGVRITRMTTIGDDENIILQSFREAEERADIILITGGLGPTEDDLTKGCLVKYFNSPLKLHPEALATITEIFKQIGRELTPVNKAQAEIPECCDHLMNKKGTAPGMWFKKGKKVFISMPGVPGEMRYLMTEEVIPRLQKEFKTDVIYHKMIRTAGIGESWLAEKIASWAIKLPSHMKLAYLPGLGQVKLRITAVGENREQLEDEVEQQSEKLKPYIEKYIYGYGSDELEMALGKLLKEKNMTLAIAESCTGGYISHLITSVPGCSEYFRGAIVPYHNELKENLLEVRHETLLKHGAVSEETVREMASSVRQQFGADIGLAISGIAGPTGGSPGKPVGTVWLACSMENVLKTKKLQLFKDRLMNIESSGVAALELVRLTLLQTVEINP